MKNIFILSLLLLPLVSSSARNNPYFKSPDGKPFIPFTKISSKQNLELTNDQSVYQFEFENMYGDNLYRVLYSIDGENSETQLKRSDKLIIETTPGKHTFQFYVDNNLEELQIDSLMILPQYCDQYIIRLETHVDPETPIMVYKPVIYLYPKKDTEVTVKVDIHGEDPFFYPSYTNEWKCTAKPTGDLVIGNETYNYLFWEAKADNSFDLASSTSGFFVEGDNIVSFLDAKLDQAGLTSKEKADFITFWGPKLAAEKLNYVHFLFNEECDRYADLNITPAPDNLYRLYMIWSPVSTRFPIKNQEMKKINRTGFTVFEWGGQVVPFLQRQTIKRTNKAIK